MAGAAATIEAHEENALARRAHVSGLVGVGVILGLGVAGADPGLWNAAWALFVDRVPDPALYFPLAVLGTCAALMFAAEACIRRRAAGRLCRVSAKLAARRYGAFAAECMLSYALGAFVLALVAALYGYLNEYGMARGGSYYGPWFRVVDLLWQGYVVLGLPYIVLTRALQDDPDADRKGVTYLVVKLAAKGLSAQAPLRLALTQDVFGMAHDPGLRTFTRSDFIALRGLLVKLFFLPLMTVFFLDQFSHLTHNFSYLGRLLGGADPAMQFGVRDFYNVSFSIVFSIDVGLAWCGYAVASRWIKNTTVSVEPTLLGWTVALLSYPPFQQVLGFYIQIPPEHGFLAIPSTPFVLAFAVVSVASYLVYMSATLVFGLRFSNLTHRGIITQGPYADIRHPAYAAKNLAWWTVMMPYVIYQAWTLDSPRQLAQILGLVALSTLYYLRAITEERHLSADPDYVAYCRRVPYRFIPKVL